MASGRQACSWPLLARDSAVSDSKTSYAEGLAWLTSAATSSLQDCSRPSSSSVIGAQRMLGALRMHSLADLITTERHPLDRRASLPGRLKQQYDHGLPRTTAVMADSHPKPSSDAAQALNRSGTPPNYAEISDSAPLLAANLQASSSTGAASAEQETLEQQRAGSIGKAPSSTASSDRRESLRASASSSGSTSKRSRTLTTPQQTAVLNALLEQTRFPTTATRERVAEELGMTPRRVQIWFQNRRQNEKRLRGQGLLDRSPSPPPPRRALPQYAWRVQSDEHQRYRPASLPLPIPTRGGMPTPYPQQHLQPPSPDLSANHGSMSYPPMPASSGSYARVDSSRAMVHSPSPMLARASTPLTHNRQQSDSAVASPANGFPVRPSSPDRYTLQPMKRGPSDPAAWSLSSQSSRSSERLPRYPEESEQHQ
ncbi:uncharacterized protein L969DRAFT_95495 [Mixia osmundae IAM 14324]|uniref:Homeobox domain-containing protein n=1 Tax=Mixia osmundae (strain CBS 9802 / IAM 14324 / JCM 22182 / KY 12970) TaxID=764103 RepID=G7E7K3_MIXOS|nr:uncharacterized protein L969DRAFT_95495 [Mixia osmundae IAM 14324]KEI38416.1 hypothetical protein L969DRAFT_95495 [Mixia osmundae IAM 14324]GAA98813.1 hypothetical protein E5Q_05501 [Mixia osmundae IAM 14324]